MAKVQYSPFYPIREQRFILLEPLNPLSRSRELWVNYGWLTQYKCARKFLFLLRNSTSIISISPFPVLSVEKKEHRSCQKHRDQRSGSPQHTERRSDWGLRWSGSSKLSHRVPDRGTRQAPGRPPPHTDTQRHGDKPPAIWKTRRTDKQ